MTSFDRAALGRLFQDYSKVTVKKKIVVQEFTYALVEVDDAFGGGEFIVRKDTDGRLVNLGGDTVIETLDGIDISQPLAEELLGRDVEPSLDLSGLAPEMPVEGKMLTHTELNQRVHERAVAGVGSDRMNSRRHSPPACRGGRLACAWAVNRIVSDALGRPVGGGLATAMMAVVLKRMDAALPEHQYEPGCIIISPTTGSVTGHVGIIGRGDLIYSNSSNEGMWRQNFDMARWKAYYRTRRGLDMLRFELAPGRFSQPAVG
ncbi:hypothetical protein [Mesorhizobium xinjiangense]|uniref:hypothetical protein n=1 Tax=Mesorhizobium xinjiangense TaxID=2678685 RepID=UPI0012EE5D98|nr:hypothetical protein [Mesorhizobium xinjiangense]